MNPLFYNFGLEIKSFLITIQNPEAIKEKTDKFFYIKIKTISSR